MNLASAIGLILSILTTVFGISFVMTSGSFNFELLTNFWDIPSIFIVFGGSFATMMIMEGNIRIYLNKLASIKLIFRKVTTNEFETIQTIIALSNVARKEGLLALEEATNEIEDGFLKKGVLLIVDGTDPELVRGILETELSCVEERHNDVIGFWDRLGAMGPAWGMIGTLIGLINMLKRLNDPGSIGPDMAVALVTTFYGSIIANVICIPVVNKLKSFHQSENPRVIEEKLKSFIQPNLRRDVPENIEFESEEVNV